MTLTAPSRGLNDLILERAAVAHVQNEQEPGVEGWVSDKCFWEVQLVVPEASLSPEAFS